MRALSIAGFLLSISVLSSCASHNEAEARADQYYSRAHHCKYTYPDSVLWFAQQIDSLPGLSEKSRARALACYGVYYNQKSSYRIAQKSYMQAIELLSGYPPDTVVAQAQTGLGNSYKNLGEYDKAIEHFLIALNIYDSVGNRGAAGVHVSMAQVYQLKEDAQSARGHLRIALGMLGSEKRSAPYLIASHTLANLYGMSGQLDSALMIDRDGIARCNTEEMRKLTTPFLDNMGQCFLLREMFDSSRICFMECLRIDSAAGEMKQVADTYINLATLSIAEKNYDQARVFIRRAIQRSAETGYLLGARNAWNILADVYMASDSFVPAMAASDSAQVYARRIINEKTEARIAELEAVYDSDKKEEQLAEQEQDLVTQRIIIAAGMVILVLVIALSLLYVAALRRRKEKEANDIRNEQERAAQAGIYETEQRERMRIARDLHDSLGQLLSVVKMQVSTRMHDRPEMKQELQPVEMLLDRSIHELRTITHNLLPEEVNLGLVPAMHSLRDTVNTSGTMRMQLHIENEEAIRRLKKEQVLAVYRIAQEVTGNMIRHSGGTQIDASLSATAHALHMQLADNGKGFADSGQTDSPGIGWRNIRARVALLHGTIQIQSAPQQGSIVKVTFNV